MVSLLKEETAIKEIIPTHTKNELERYLEEMGLPSCTPKHLLTEEQTIVAARENAPLVALAAQMPQVTVQKDTSLAKSQAGVLTQINQKEKAQEKLDAFLRQSEVFTLRQDLRFKYDKKDVLIEQGARIKIHCAELSGNGNKVKLDLCSVTKDDWDSADFFFGNHKFSYTNLHFNIDTLEKYLEPDIEVTRLMKRKDIFSHLFKTSIGVSLIWVSILILHHMFSFFTYTQIEDVLSAVGSGLFSVLSVLWGVLCMRTRGAVYKRLRDVENQILQRTLMQQEDEGGNE